MSAGSTSEVWLASIAHWRMIVAVNAMINASERSLEEDIEAIARDRDREAFVRLFNYYAPRIKTYLKRLSADDQTAEDLAQEVMISVWQRAHQFDSTKAALGTWIYTIARNKRIDALRRERRPEFEWDDPSLVPEPPLRGDVHMEQGALRDMIREAILELPHEQAQLLRIYYFEEKTHTAIAEELGLPLGTVKSRLRLAMEKLRALLGGLAP